ncbi:MAG TPA: hypothetical protein VG733_07460 [Chthoniobacteraceae bacterium]|nr:hypothetical protein [Chthoniobacteraceae bacterium]
MKKLITLMILCAALAMSLGACAHHEEQQTQATTSSSTGYKK